MCCSANNKLPGHNDVLEAMAKCLRRIGISTSRTTVLVHARRSDRNGEHKMEMDALRAELTRVSEAVLEPEQKPEQKLAKADQEARAALLGGV